MDELFDMLSADVRECSIKITSRHYVHDIGRFAKYGVVPSLFGANGQADGDVTDPEDFPDEMNDALDEILQLEHEKFGSPAEVIDPYAPEEDEEDDDGESESDELPADYSPAEELNRKLEELMRLLSADGDEDEDDALIFETRGTIERCVRDGRPVIEVRYTEDESMDGTETIIRFDRTRPHSALISHTGGVMSTLILDEGVRHITVYQTPIMPFEIAVYTKKCRGGFTFGGGSLELDYMLELRGADLQRTVMTIEAYPVQ